MKQNNPHQSQIRTTLTGLPKLTFDNVKQRSNIFEVEKALNYYVQQHFTTLYDCIATRAVDDIIEPLPPLPSSLATQFVPSRRLRSASTTTPSEEETNEAEEVPEVSNNLPELSVIQTSIFKENYRMYLARLERNKKNRTGSTFW
jgi:hypothetical protein